MLKSVAISIIRKCGAMWSACEIQRCVFFVNHCLHKSLPLNWHNGRTCPEDTVLAVVRLSFQISTRQPWGGISRDREEKKHAVICAWASRWWWWASCEAQHRLVVLYCNFLSQDCTSTLGSIVSLWYDPVPLVMYKWISERRVTCRTLPISEATPAIPMHTPPKTTPVQEPWLD